jgi:cytochrome c
MKILLLPALFVVGIATVQADQALATKNNCMACHAVDRKLVGPSYRDVAKKYVGTSADALAASIRKGGSGKWGAIPMPAQPQLSESDARKLATWILEIK